MLERYAWWNCLPCGAKLGQGVCCFIVCSWNMVELATFKISADLLHQESVARHVSIFCIPRARALLYHQIGVTIALNIPNTDFLGQLDTMHKGFVLGYIVRCCKVNLEHILQLISPWG